MPLFSTLNMATPIINNSTTSQIFVLPEQHQIFNNLRTDSNRKYNVLKCIELTLTLSSLIFLTIGDTWKDTTGKYMVIHAFLGAITLYPMLCMAFSLRFYKTPRRMLVCNIIISFVLFVLSILTLSSWWNMEIPLDDTDNENSDISLNVRFSATFRFVSAMFCIVNGIVYTSESLVMALEVNGYV